MSDKREPDGDEEFKNFLNNQPQPLSVPDFVVLTNNEKIDRLTNLLKLSIDGAKVTEDLDLRVNLSVFAKSLMDEITKSMGMYSMIMFREMENEDPFSNLPEGPNNAA